MLKYEMMVVLHTKTIIGIECRFIASEWVVCVCTLT